MKQRVYDIRDDLKEGTKHANLRRQKVVNKDEHIGHSDKKKPDMKSILAKKPLIVRNNLQIPKYPKKKANNDSQGVDMPVIDQLNSTVELPHPDTDDHL